MAPAQRPAARPDLFRQLAKKSQSAVDIDNNWLITLSDVLSLLLIFFVMFIVMAKPTTTSTAAPPPAPPPAAALIDTGLPKAAAPAFPVRDKIVREVGEGIRQLHLGDDVSVRAMDKEVLITLKEQITFRPGEAETLKDSEPILDNIAEIIQRYPSYLVEIEGHTDNVPINTALYPSNWELSVARATSVLKYFIGRHGIEPSRLSIKGDADQQPVAPNDTPDNRARNRRVDIRLKEANL